MTNAPASLLKDGKQAKTAFNTLRTLYDKPVAQVSLELVATVVAVILLAALAIRPTLNSISRLLTDIEDRKKTNQALIRKEAALSTVSQDMLRLKNKITKLDAALPKTADLDGLLKRIEKTASDANLPISELRVAVIPYEVPPGDQPKPQEQTISLTFTAPYEKVEKFLTGLETMDRTTRINRVTMDSVQDKTTQNIQVSAELVFYNYGAPFTAPASSKAPANNSGAGTP